MDNFGVEKKTTTSLLGPKPLKMSLNGLNPPTSGDPYFCGSPKELIKSDKEVIRDLHTQTRNHGFCAIEH